MTKKIQHLTPEWTYRNQTITDEVIPEKAIGYIYQITNIVTQQRYIGKKLLVKPAYKTVNKKKTRVLVASDWKSYWSSSPELLTYIEENGTDNLVREILMFCNTKSELLYAEEALLYHVDAILSSEWSNSNIRSRIYRKWFEKNSADFMKRMQETRMNLS
jgi:hypothetical protein